MLPAFVEVEIEVRKGGFIKPRASGGIDFVSPLPCPFNYGCLPDTLGDDGDPLDALVLGPALAPGVRIRVPVLGVVRFVDDGNIDDKLVCGQSMTEGDIARVTRFFRLYGRAKTVLNLARGRRGDTAYRGFDRREG